MTRFWSIRRTKNREQRVRAVASRLQLEGIAAVLDALITLFLERSATACAIAGKSPADNLASFGDTPSVLAGNQESGGIEEGE